MNQQKVRCNVCPHNCVFREEGDIGWCGVRIRRNNQVELLTYGVISSAAMDPIEKKPLYHFLPGTDVYSIGGWGCNLGCLHCQNYRISQQYKDQQQSWIDDTVSRRSPKDIVAKAKSLGSPSIALTYNEPTIWYEFALDIAKEAHKEGLKLVLVTSAYETHKTAETLSKQTDAANIDLKGFTNDFYRKVCKGKLQPVLDAIEIYQANEVHIELTTLLIPGYNDSAEEINDMMDWVVDTLGTEVPHHFSRFFPMNQLTDAPSTPKESLIRAYNIAKDHGLKYVYLGNIRSETGNHTRCPKCDNLIIRRSGYHTTITGLKSNTNKCNACGKELPIVLE